MSILVSQSNACLGLVKTNDAATILCEFRTKKAVDILTQMTYGAATETNEAASILHELSLMRTDRVSPMSILHA